MFHLTESRPARDEITLYPNLGRGLVDTIKCLHLAEGVIIKVIDSKQPNSVVVWLLDAQK